MKILKGVDNKCIIDFCVHISDIHIRLNSRFEEYYYIFQLFINEMREMDPKKLAIFITGDLFHNKNELTPLCIELALSLIDGLNELGVPVFIIPGNHDFMIHNKDKGDNITALLSKRLFQNVYYLKTTGIYRYLNLLITHNSLWDGKWVTGCPRVHDNDRTILLYHGMINGCRFQNGLIDNSGEIKVDKLYGYDYVFLGDIHLHQYLRPNIAYAGSMISQNFGETDINHGYILWDISENKSSFHILENPCAHRQIIIHPGSQFEYLDDKYSSIDDISLPSQTNLRIVVRCTELSQDIKKKMMKWNPKYIYLSDKEDNPEIIITPNNETELLKSFLSSKVPSASIPKFIELLNTDKKNKSYSWKILDLSFDNLFGYGPNNFISFEKNVHPNIYGIFGPNSIGKSTLIDILLFMLYGKISRYLCGNSIPKELINEYADHFKGVLRIQIGNDKYRIEKSGKFTKNEKIRIDEKLFCETTNTNLTDTDRIKTDKFITSMIGDHELFMFISLCLQKSYKSFRDFTQTQRKEFLYSIFQLNEYQELYMRYNQEMKTKEKEFELLDREKYSFYSEKEWKTHFCDLDNRIKKEKKELEELSCLIAEKKEKTMEYVTTINKYNSIQKSLTEYSKLTNSFSCINENEDELRLMISKLKQENNRIHIYKIDYKNDIQFHYREWLRLRNIDFGPKEDKYNKQIFELALKKHKKVLETDEKNVLILYKRYKDIDIPLIEKECNKLSELSLMKQKLETECTYIRDELRVHSDIEYNPECKQCRDNPFRKRKHELLSKCDELSQGINNINEEIQQHVKYLTELDLLEIDHDKKYVPSYWTRFFKKISDHIRERIEHYSCKLNYYENQELEKKVNHYKQKLLDHENKKKKYNDYSGFIKYLEQFILYRSNKNYKQEKNNQILELEERLRKYQEYKKFKELQELCEAYKKEMIGYEKYLSENKDETDEIILLEKKYNSSNVIHIRNNMEYERQQEEYKEWKKYSEKYNRTKNEIDELKILCEITHKDGFPLYIIKNYIPQLEDYMNKILSNFIDKKIHFEMDQNDILFYTRNQKNHIMNMYGGMESLMIDLAIKITFAKYGYCGISNFFIMDENISVLDKEHLQNISILFDFLKNHFQHVLLISHISSIQDLVDQNIIIQKNNNKSLLRFISN